MFSQFGVVRVFREKRYLRYLGILVLGLVCCWLPAVAYLVLTPKSFTSSFIMIIPGPGTTSTLNLQNIGSATSSNASVFSSPDISPTENYKRILLSHKLIEKASGLLNEDPETFSPPKVDLVDQTKFMMISVSGKDVMTANHRAEAVRNSFMSILDDLRMDEIQILHETTDKIIMTYDEKLAQAKTKLLAHQVKTGLISKEQYNTLLLNLEKAREQKRDLEARISKDDAEKAELIKILGTTPDKANYAMLLRADPIFQGLLDTLAKEESEIAILNGIRGVNNPRLQDALAEKANVTKKMLDRGHELTPMSRDDIMKSRDISLRDERARLFEKLINLSSEGKSLEANLTTVEAQIKSENQRVIELANAVSELENLTREVQVAEAVFTSSLAKIDTSKSDFFSSYPMIQVLDAPYTSSKPTSPRKIYAFLGAGVATMLLLALSVLMWTRQKMFKKILRYL